MQLGERIRHNCCISALLMKLELNQVEEMYLLPSDSCRLEIVIWKNTEERGKLNESRLTCQICSNMFFSV